MSVHYSFLTKHAPVLTPVVPIGTPNNSWWPDYKFPDQIWPTAAEVQPPPFGPFWPPYATVFPELATAIAALNSAISEAAQNILSNHNAVLSAQGELDTAVANLATAQNLIAAQGLSIGGMQTGLSSANIQILALQNDQQSVAGTLTTLNSRMGSAEGTLTSLATTVTNNHSSLVGITNNLQAQFDNATARLTSVELAQSTEFEALTASILTQSSRIDNSLAILSIESFTRSTQTTTLASTLATLTVNMNGLTGQISTEQAARIDGDTVNVTAITRIMAVATQRRVYAQSTQPTTPTGGFQVGDQWFNTAAGAFPYAWNGSAWVDNSSGQYSSLAASITTEANARVNQDSALTGYINTQISAVNGNISTVSNQAATLSTQYSSLSGTVTNIQATTNQNVADIHTVQVTQTTQYSAISGRVDQVWTTVNGNSAGITQLTQTVNGISAQWSLQATLNNQTGGLSLTGIQKADGTGAIFTLDITANVRIHGSVLFDSSLTNNKAANESWTVIRGLSGVQPQNLSQGGPNTVYTWNFSSPIGGHTIVSLTTTLFGGADGMNLIWYLYLDGSVLSSESVTIGRADVTYAVNIQVDTTIAVGAHILELKIFDYFLGDAIGQITSTAFVGSK